MYMNVSEGRRSGEAILHQAYFALQFDEPAESKLKSVAFRLSATSLVAERRKELTARERAKGSTIAFLKLIEPEQTLAHR